MSRNGFPAWCRKCRGRSRGLSPAGSRSCGSAGPSCGPRRLDIGRADFQIGDEFSFDGVNRRRKMDWQPPEGSSISVATDGADRTVEIPRKAGASRYFTGLFMLIWLGMWTVGFRDAGTKVISGN